MTNVKNSCMSYENVGFRHHRQTSPPSGFLSDSDVQSDGGDKNLQMVLNGV